MSVGAILGLTVPVGDEALKLFSQAERRLA